MPSRACTCAKTVGMQVTASHRLDTNKAEQGRVKALGCEVSATTLEGKAVGPLRVWPGGLAMSRTLGDFEVRSAQAHAQAPVRVLPCTDAGCAPPRWR